MKQWVAMDRAVVEVEVGIHREATAEVGLLGQAEEDTGGGQWVLRPIEVLLQDMITVLLKADRANMKAQIQALQDTEEVLQLLATVGNKRRQVHSMGQGAMAGVRPVHPQHREDMSEDHHLVGRLRIQADTTTRSEKHTKSLREMLTDSRPRRPRHL